MHRVARSGRALGGGLALVAAMALVGCATARADGPEVVRVLLYAGAGPIPVGPVGHAAPLRLAGEQLEWDGARIGDRHAPAGPGPWRVGARRVRGRIVARIRDGRIEIVNRVGLEDYVASTVGGEMSPSWPREALRAQAVATRTYAVHEALKRRGEAWDVRATTRSQVYRGLATESDATRAAARATRGEVLTHHGEPILAVFHSTAGGRTATAGEVWGRDLPYLRVVDVEEEDDAPHTYWRAEWTAGDLEAVLAESGLEVGRLAGLAVTRRTRSGRVAALEIRGASGVETLRSDRLRSIVGTLGLRSTLFDVRRTPEGFAFVGSGHGHGVGMSQWGARALAERGVSYQRILARFYPGTRLERWTTRRVAGPVERDAARHGRRGGTTR